MIFTEMYDPSDYDFFNLNLQKKNKNICNLY